MLVMPDPPEIGPQCDDRSSAGIRISHLPRSPGVRVRAVNDGNNEIGFFQRLTVCRKEPCLFPGSPCIGIVAGLLREMDGEQVLFECPGDRCIERSFGCGEERGCKIDPVPGKDRNVECRNLREPREEDAPAPRFAGPSASAPKYVLVTPQVGDELTPMMQSGGPRSQMISFTPRSSWSIRAMNSGVLSRSRNVPGFRSGPR
jgi:hypothetical protein